MCSDLSTAASSIIILYGLSVFQFLSFFCRRRAYNNLDAHSFVSCLGKRKSKHKLMYSSLHSGLFEAYDMVLYEPVIQVKDFHYKTLVLIGE